MDITIFQSSTVEECLLAHKIAMTGNDELLDEASENISRPKVLMMAAVMRHEIVACLVHDIIDPTATPEACAYCHGSRVMPTIAGPKPCAACDPRNVNN